MANGGFDVDFSSLYVDSGARDYDKLKNLPKLNGLTISGDKTALEYNFGTVYNKNIGNNAGEVPVILESGKLDESILPVLSGAQSDWEQSDNTKNDYIKNKPTKLSQFLNDEGFIATEIDPVFAASVASSITAENYIAWNNKSDFSGNYSDLIGKPTSLSEFTDDLGTSPMHTHAQYITTETDPTVPSWAKQENKPTYSVAEVSGAQSIVDNSLTTTDKTIVGAINEINSTVGTLNDELELALGGGV